jgi:hypothetical protein
MGRCEYFFIRDKDDIAILNECSRVDCQKMCGNVHYKDDEGNLHISKKYILTFSIQEGISF